MLTSPRRSRLWRPFVVAPGLVACLFAFMSLLAQPALACGGLVAPDGDVRLGRAATLIAWHNGIEHYLTSFTYEGSVKNLGWVVPLPAVPLKIEDGGAWTLQRLARETHPAPTGLTTAQVEFAGASAQVLQQVKIEALNVTVLRGSGQAVLDWCAQNGFAVDGDTRAHLLTYASASPIFMAAKYDTAAAQARGQHSGDGVPLLITMRTAQPWVPLEVLALDGQQVHADLYFLTDEPLNSSAVGAVAGQSSVGSTVAGAPDLKIAYQEPMNASLYHDLSTDRNMGWVRSDGWLTYVSLDAPSLAVRYDLSISRDGVFKALPFGAAQAKTLERAIPGWLPRLPIGTPEVVCALALAALTAWAALAYIGWRPRHSARK